MVVQISDINALYINLEHRLDRRQHVEQELKRVGINADRFPAIHCPDNGAIGCSMSHLKCIEIAKCNNWEYILICEDDIEFINPQVFVDHLNRLLSSKIPWDVIMLGGNIIEPYLKINTACAKIQGGCQTTTGYIVKNHYYDILINNIKNGITKLIKDPTNKSMYAIDRYWIQLQQIHHWYIIIPLTVSQISGYSDIENKEIDYKSKMIKNITPLRI